MKYSIYGALFSQSNNAYNFRANDNTLLHYGLRISSTYLLILNCLGTYSISFKDIDTVI